MTSIQNITMYITRCTEIPRRMEKLHNLEQNLFEFGLRIGKSLGKNW